MWVRHSHLFRRLCNFSIPSLNISFCRHPLVTLEDQYTLLFFLVFFSGCYGDSRLSALYNPGIWARFLQEIVRGGIFFLSTVTKTPESPLPTCALPCHFSQHLESPACDRGMAWDGECGGPDRGCSWAGEEPFVTDLGPRSQAPRGFPQDLVTWHNPINHASLSKELQDNMSRHGGTQHHKMV